MFKRTFATLATAVLCSPLLCAAAWEPSKPVEFVVPAGTGGGADQMARFIQGVVAKNRLSIFWSNPLVGSIAGLAIAMLLWPAYGGLKAAIRRPELVADGRLPR